MVFKVLAREGGFVPCLRTENRTHFSWKHLWWANWP